MFGYWNNNFKRGCTNDNKQSFVLEKGGGCSNNWMVGIIRIITVLTESTISDPCVHFGKERVDVLRAAVN